MSIQAERMRGVPRNREGIEVRLIFLACFFFSFIQVVARRLVRGNTTGQSVVFEAKAAADSCVSFALMG